jgi:sulfate adenylyltransferase subunit 2
MDKLDLLESQSIYILREAYNRVKPLGMLWSLGKDSNVMLWLCKKAFFGYVPFKTILLDTGNELDEVYEFRDKYVREWDLSYMTVACPSIDETDPSLPPKSRMAARKTLGLKSVIEKNGFKGILLGIRRDEQAIRSKEKVFSPRQENGDWKFRDQPIEFWDHYKTDFPAGIHLRIHPLLSWSELDIWRYIKRERIPVVSLYFARDGKRYRSLGEKDITEPVDSNAATLDEIIEELKIIRQPERAGRTMDHEREDSFEKLRSSGYM